MGTDVEMIISPGDEATSRCGNYQTRRQCDQEIGVYVESKFQIKVTTRVRDLLGSVGLCLGSKLRY